jgi:aspartyl protease family protein
VGFGTIAFSKSDIVNIERTDPSYNETLVSSWKRAHVENFPPPTPEDEEVLAALKALIDEREALDRERAKKKLLLSYLQEYETTIPALQAQVEKATQALKSVNPQKDITRYNVYVLEYNTLSQRLRLAIDARDKARQDFQKLTETETRHAESLLQFKTRVETTIRTLAASPQQDTERTRFYEDLQAKIADMEGAIVQEELSINPHEAGIIVSATVNNAGIVTLVVDTGASLVILSKDAARRLGIDSDAIKESIELVMADGRRSRAKYIVLDTIAVDDAQAPRVEAAIVNDPPQKNVDGLLGMSYLRRFSFRIDQEKKKLYLSAFRQDAP